MPQMTSPPNNEFNASASGENLVFEDVITGSGYLLNTPFFYGYYSSDYLLGDYSMATAYFYTILVIFVVTLLLQSIRYYHIISIWSTIHKIAFQWACRMAGLFSRNFIQAQATDPHEFCTKIFAGWDFAIRGTHREINQTAIATQLKILLDQKKQESKDSLGKTASALEVIVHILVLIWTIGALIGIGYGTFEMLSRFQRDNFWTLMLPAAYVMLLMQIVPRIFSIVAKANIRGSNGSAIRTRVYQTLGQTVALGLTLIVVTATVYRHPNPEVDDNSDSCWENQLGQEMWRWLLVYFFGIVLLTFLGETAYRFIQPKLNFQSFIKFEPPEFDIAQNTMYLIFGQTITWVGLYHCPLLPLLFSLVLLVYFYIKLLSLRVNCNVSIKPWRAGQSQTIFYMLTFTSLIVASVVYFLDLRERSSPLCGPFRDRASDEWTLEYPYEILFQGEIRYILYPGVAGFVVTTLMYVGLSPILKCLVFKIF